MSNMTDKMPFDDYDHILPDSSFSIELDNDPDPCIMSECSSIPHIATSEFLGTMICVLFALNGPGFMFLISNVLESGSNLIIPECSTTVYTLINTPADA